MIFIKVFIISIKKTYRYWKAIKAFEQIEQELIRDAKNKAKKPLDRIK